MKIKFISHAGTHLASQRMRVQFPVEALKKEGYETSYSNKVESDDDIIVFQKHFNPVYDYQMAKSAKAFGKTVIFDICDDHFLTEKFKDYYLQMMNLADVVTVCGPNIQQVIKELYGIETFVVKDPITFPKYSPRKIKSSPSFLWYGHVSNLQGLLDNYAQIKDEKVTIITNGQNFDGLPPNFTFLPWKEGLVEQEILKHDAVLLPLSPDKQNKNTNRAVDALHAGRFVITDSERVYGELKPFIFVGTLKDGVTYVKGAPQEASKKIVEGQEYVLEHYSNRVVTNEWKGAIEYASTKSTAA